ncbi:RDD family protein [Nocardioides hwasunensis]|uniref:RDD family protein n=1 Tax=Nocardioides hwasunensis TaxID=397258 RepID=UPI0029649287|nr:RDD family protein [Nocardioides hwasunensis]
MTSPVTTDLQPASWGRRILALLIDWLTCLAIVEGLVAAGVLASNPYSLATMALYVVEASLFTTLMGGSFGKLATRVRVVHHKDPSRPVQLIPAFVRSLLVVLVIPPLLTVDGRGLHDLAAGTRTVTIQ